MRHALRVSALVFLLASLAVPASGGEGDTLITDPDLLTRLGFPRDARYVYLAKGAVLEQKSSPAEPKEFGSSDFGWTTVLGNQHQPESSSMEYATNSGFGIYEIGVATGAFSAQIQMPSGALLQQVAWFGSDDDGNVGAYVQGTVWRVCQTGIPIGPPIITVLGSGNSSSETGSFIFVVVPPPGEIVDNLRCAYIARTIFLAAGPSLVLRKVRAGWQRQVSPAPASATFPNDVPITHPYFRFIEALARSGITAGCTTTGSFCPDAPITRGEMAVFLADALGLHFSN